MKTYKMMKLATAFFQRYSKYLTRTLTRAWAIVGMVLGIINNVSAQNDTLAALPFKIGADSRIYIQCKVNDKDGLTFLFDTGASDMVFNNDSVGKLLHLKVDGKIANEGANGQNDVQVSNGNNVIFGKLAADSVRFLAIAYPVHDFDGVFGLSLISKYVITVDYDKKIMSFFDPASYVYQGDAVKIKNKYSHNVPIIAAKIKIENRVYKGYYEIDTGSDRVIDLFTPFVERNNFRNKLKKIATMTTRSSDGNESKLLMVRIPELSIGGYSFYLTPGALSVTNLGLNATRDFEGVFGNNFLKRFNITYNLSKNTLWLSPNNYTYTNYYNFLTK